MKIHLTEWALRHYSPAPSLWTLRKMAREGRLYPAPVKTGKHWYIDEHAREVNDARPSVADRLRTA